MSKCAIKEEQKQPKMIVRNSWRLRTLFRIEKLIREIGQDNRDTEKGEIVCNGQFNRS